MDIQKVIDRALADPFFAADLAAKAGRASRARSGVGPTEPIQGDEWQALLSEFADTPDELARLMPPTGSASLVDTTGTVGTVMTVTTTTTLTSLACTVTSTTTTTTVTTLTTTHLVE